MQISFIHVFLIIFNLIILARPIELVLDFGEQYYVNLDEAYQMDFTTFNLTTSDYSSNFSYTITPRIIKYYFRMNRTFLKVIEKPSSPGFFIALEPQSIVLLFLNTTGIDMKIREVTDLRLGDIIGSDPLMCQSVVYLLNLSIIVDCNVLNQNKTLFLVLNLAQNISNTTEWSFTLERVYSPNAIPDYLFSCIRRKFFCYESFFFYFCPFSHIFESYNQQIYYNQMNVYGFDFFSREFFEIVIVKDKKIQDIIVAYDNYYVVLDYEQGLLFYQFLVYDAIYFDYISKIPLPETNYLYLSTRTIDSVYPEQIKNFLYVASHTNILEILYNSPKSIVYSKFYPLNSKNESNFTVCDMLLTPKFVIAIQKNYSSIDLDTYIFKIFSNDLKRISTIHQIEYFQTNFLRGFFFNLYQDKIDNVVLSFQEKTGNITYALLEIDDSKLIVSCCTTFLYETLITSIRLTAFSTYNNKNVNFTNDISLYLIPYNDTGITYRKNFQRNYTFPDNYFEFPLKSISLGSNIEYWFLGNGNYGGSGTNIGNIFLDFIKTIIIRDRAFADNRIFYGYMEFQAQVLTFVMYNPTTQELFHLICTDYRDQSFKRCSKDETFLKIKQISYIYIKYDFVFIYSQSLNTFFVCYPFKKLCGSNYTNENIKYDEILYINNNLIIGRINMTNGIVIDILSLSIEVNEKSDNPTELLMVKIKITQHYEQKDSDSNVQSLDSNFIDFNLLAIKTNSKIILLKITSKKFTNYKLIKTFELDIKNCSIFLLKIGKLVNICFDDNIIVEYNLKNPYEISKTRYYPLFWYKIVDQPAPSTDQKYIYIAGINTRNNASVLLIYNPNSPTSEILIKICFFSFKILKLIPISSVLDSYSIVYLRLSDEVPYDYVLIVNMNPYLYGNFSEPTFLDLYSHSKPAIQFDIMFTNGHKKLVASIFSNISMNDSELTKSMSLYNETRFVLEENLKKKKYYTIPIDYLFKGPIEEFNFSVNDSVNFPFRFQDIIKEYQILSDYPTSAFLYKRTIDMKFFDNLFIVLTEDYLVFIVNSFFLNIIYKEKIEFLEPTCKISHHDTENYFIIYCNGNETFNNTDRGRVVLYNYTIDLNNLVEFLKDNTDLAQCFGCIKLNHSVINLPDEFGKIKKVIIKSNYFLSLSYLINNKNQEIFTICDFRNMSYDYSFVQIASYKASDFDLTYFKTKDIDILAYNFSDYSRENSKLLFSNTTFSNETSNFSNETLNFTENKNFDQNSNIPPFWQNSSFFHNSLNDLPSDNYSINFFVVFILDQQVLDLESNNILTIDFHLSIFNNNHTSQIQNSNLNFFLDPSTIKILNYTEKNSNFSMILGTSKRFYEIYFTFNSTPLISYTYEHYHRCESLTDKPEVFSGFLVAICTRIDKGEMNPEVQPIFRVMTNYTTILIYKRESKDIASYPIRMLTNYIADQSYRKKVLVFKGIKTNGDLQTKLLVSDPFNFLVVYDLYQNISFHLKSTKEDLIEVHNSFNGILTAMNKFDYAQINLVFKGKNRTNINKIIVYVLFGFLFGMGMLLMVVFLFFFDKKKRGLDQWKG